jgi:alpha-N-arabinofuranosidase
MKIAGILTALAALATFAGTSPALSADSSAGNRPQYRNLFSEYLGASNAALDAKIDAAWNQLFYGDDASQRVYYPVGDDMAYIYTPDSDDVRSEGMSYGMMIAVQLNKKAEFDRLWKWAKTYMYHAEGSRKGYFAWQCRTDGTMIDPGSASDGEEWFATALFFASARWGDGRGIFNYRAEANAILHTMLHTGDEGAGEEKTSNMFDAESKLVRFVPNLTWAKVTDVSYQLPFFYDIWAACADKDNAFWREAADASRAFYHTAANPVTGLVSEYTYMDGRPFAPGGKDVFAFDAHRTLAWPALDSLFSGKDAEWQRMRSNRVLSTLKPHLPLLPAIFTLEGAPTVDYSSESIAAMAAVAALAADRETGEPFVRKLWETPVPSGQYRYYNGLVYFLGLLQAGGRFHLYMPDYADGSFAPEKVAFKRFSYTGSDACFAAQPAGPGQYTNPVFPGFRPDPSICFANGWFYAVNSSFAYFPGVPVSRSRDLTHWENLGHVLTRPSQLPLEQAGTSRGIYAPAISYHNGVFYMVTTNVSGGGNFYVTAKDPAGPWSDPVWLPQVDGIDPSFFFDEKTGKAWLVNNGPPPENKPLYDGHRAIWIQEFDEKTGQLVGPRSIIVNGGTDLSKKPVWIEGPHLFRRGEWLYLIAAEGGTAEDHSEVVFRAKDPMGPWVPWEGNPILTQRDLPGDRTLPVTCAGHADFVDAGNAGWWAVFLACRPYAGNLYATGRETFLLPVTWTPDGWPVILKQSEPIPYAAKSPALSQKEAAKNPILSGNFTWSDDFSEDTLRPDWATVRTPRGTWREIGGSRCGSRALLLSAGPATLASTGRPSYAAYRVQHADSATEIEFAPPESLATDAGLALFQSEKFCYFLGVRKSGTGYEVFLDKTEKGATIVTAKAAISVPEGTSVRLKAELNGAALSFYYSLNGEWKKLADADGALLTTARAGGFVGTTVGPFARTR